MLGDVTMEQNFHSLPNVDRHFLELLPPTDKKEKTQKRCVICTKEKKRKESRYQCKTCSNCPGVAQILALKFFIQLLSKLAYIKRVVPIFKTLFIENILESN